MNRSRKGRLSERFDSMPDAGSLAGVRRTAAGTRGTRYAVYAVSTGSAGGPFCIDSRRAGSNHDAAGLLQMDGGVVEKRSRNSADIGHVASGANQTFQQSGMQTVATQANITAKRDVVAAASLALQVSRTGRAP